MLIQSDQEFEARELEREGDYKVAWMRVECKSRISGTI